MNQSILAVQTIVQAFQGYIYRSYLDEKGLNIFVIYGGYPQAHQEDATRGVLTGTLIIQELLKTDIPATVGVATGHARFSVSGEYRKDLFIIGEPLYMAYLLMLVTIKDPEKRILVDYETKIEAEAKISFANYNNPVFQNKISKGIFEPIYSLDNLKPLPYNTFPNIRTHHFNPDYALTNSEEDYLDSFFMVGREQDLKARLDMITKFLKTPARANLLLIGGSFGSGKSLFARNLLERSAELIQNTYAGNDRPQILTSSLNPYTKMLKLNGWRTIMREILAILASQSGRRKEDYLYGILESYKDLQANINIVADILDVRYDLGNPFNERTPTYTFVSKEEEVPVYEQKIIINIMMILLKNFVGESASGAYEEESGPSFGGSRPPLIVCLDDMHNHDEVSWNLTNKALKRIRRIFVIGIVRSEELEASADRTDIIDQGIREIASNPEIIPDKLILNPLVYGDIEKILRKLLPDQPSDELTRFVLEKSEGNPLVAVDFLDKLVKQELLQSVNREIFPRDLLKKFIRLRQYIEILAPNSRNKVNGHKADQLQFNHYHLLKIASAAGNSFDLRTLIVTNPFHHTILSPKEILTYLNDLKQFEIIDVVNDKTKNIVFQFNSSFLRETIYQRIPFSLRRGLHRMIAESWQNAEDPLENEFVLYQWNLSDPDSNFQDDYTNSAKRTFIIRDINTKLAQSLPSKGDPVIKTGKLEKLSYRDRTRWIPRFFVLTPYALKYYKTETEFRDKPVFETGSIPLKNILTMIPIYKDEMFKASERPGFRITASKWYKGPNENPGREFIFGCENNEEIESWQINIEYMRSKILYEEFISSFDPRTVPFLRTQGLNTTQSNIASIETSPRLTSYNKDERIKTVGYSLNQDHSVGETLGYQSGGRIMSKEQLRESNRPSQRSPLKTTEIATKAAIRLQNLGSPSRRISKKESLLSFLNRGQALFWAQAFGAPVESSPRKIGVKETITPNRENIGSTKTQGYIPILSQHVEKTISNKLRGYDQDNRSPRDMLGPSYESANNERYSKFTEHKRQMGSPKSFPSKIEQQYQSSPPSKREKVKQVNLSAVPIQKESDEMVETIIKQKRAKGIPNKEQQPRETKLNLAKISPKKGKKILNRPNIYGRYEFFPTFFIDGHLDDRAIRSINNEVNNVQEKMRIKKEKQLKNIPRTMYIKKDVRDGENIYLYNEECYLRQKGDNTTIPEQRSNFRPEEEPPIYKTGLNRYVNDLVNESYRLSPPKKQPLIEEKPSFIYKNINTDRSTSPFKIESLGPQLLPHTLTARPQNRSTIINDFSKDYSNFPTQRTDTPKLTSVTPYSFIKTDLGTPSYQPIIPTTDDPLKPKSSYPFNRDISPIRRDYSPQTDYSPNRELFPPSESLKYTQPYLKAPGMISTVLPLNLQSNIYQPSTTLTSTPLSTLGNPLKTDFTTPKTSAFEPSSPYTQPFEFKRNYDFLEPKSPLLKGLSPIVSTTINTTINNPIPKMSYYPPETHATASFPEKRESVTVKSPNKKDIDPSQYFYLGHALRASQSQDGDHFKVDKGEFVVVTRVYEKQGLVELLWKGLSGLFPINDIEIIKKTDIDEVNKHITLRPSSSAAHSGSEKNYKMVYSEHSDFEDDSQRSFNMGENRSNYSQYSHEEFSMLGESGISRNIEDSNYSYNPNNTTPGKLPSKMAKRQQKRQQQGIYSGDESVFANQ